MTEQFDPLQPPERPEAQSSQSNADDASPPQPPDAIPSEDTGDDVPDPTYRTQVSRPDELTNAIHKALDTAESTGDSPITSIMNLGSVVRRERVGSALTRQPNRVTLTMDGAHVPLEIRPGQELVLGRNTGPGHHDRLADINLDPFSAREHGVSRQHAALLNDDGLVKIKDLGSTNGTYINGTRLVAYQPRLLRDGDALHLGSLEIRVEFA